LVPLVWVGAGEYVHAYGSVTEPEAGIVVPAGDPFVNAQDPPLSMASDRLPSVTLSQSFGLLTVTAPATFHALSVKPVWLAVTVEVAVPAGSRSVLSTDLAMFQL